MEIEIEHDESVPRFVALVEGQEAYLRYSRLPDGRLDFWRTFVPETLGGRGIAGQLVTFALDYAESEGLEVIPSCSYVARFIEKRSGSGE